MQSRSMGSVAKIQVQVSSCHGYGLVVLEKIGEVLHGERERESRTREYLINP
jgi:hypothetical protein